MKAMKWILAVVTTTMIMIPPQSANAWDGWPPRRPPRQLRSWLRRRLPGRLRSSVPWARLRLPRSSVLRARPWLLPASLGGLSRSLPWLWWGLLGMRIGGRGPGRSGHRHHRRSGDHQFGSTAGGGDRAAALVRPHRGYPWDDTRAVQRSNPIWDTRIFRMTVRHAE